MTPNLKNLQSPVNQPRVKKQRRSQLQKRQRLRTKLTQFQPKVTHTKFTWCISMLKGCSENPLPRSSRTTFQILPPWMRRRCLLLSKRKQSNSRKTSSTIFMMICQSLISRETDTILLKVYKFIIKLNFKKVCFIFLSFYFMNATNFQGVCLKPYDSCF